jgi:phosphatidylglycerol lysyltransferase
MSYPAELQDHRTGPSAASRRSGRKLWRGISALATVAVFIAALVFLHHLLHEVSLASVTRAFAATGWREIALSALFTAGSYLALTGYDYLAVRHVGYKPPYSATALASFTSFTFANNLGLGGLTGGAIRYRIYSALRVAGSDIALIVVICGVIFWLGILAVLGFALVIEPHLLARSDFLRPVINRALGLMILGFIGAYMVYGANGRRSLQVKGLSFAVPGYRATLKQIAVGVADSGCAAMALYSLLPPHPDLTFPAFFGIYAVAVALGFLSHAPGGIGVFEAVMLLALPGIPKEQLLGAILMYRVIYYLLPLGGGALALALHELRVRAELSERVSRTVRLVRHVVVPYLIGGLVLFGGVVLLISGATPAEGYRIRLLRDFVPLPFVEASHFLGSVVGLWLVILSRGLLRRLDSAWLLSVCLVAAGIVFSLVKGLDYEEALILTLVLATLVTSHHAFYRKGSLLAQPFSIRWAATIVVIAAASIWLGFFAFKTVDYSSDLWWKFAYHGDAPRFLRASFAVVVIGTGFLIYLFTRTTRPRIAPPITVPDGIKALVRRSNSAESNLACTGDKSFLVSGDGRAFLMYGVSGRSWIVMGDPVGDPGSWPELVWRFRELVDQYGGWPAFYEVGKDHLPLYLDLGLSLTKIGEEARVLLADYSLEGPSRRDERYWERRLSKEGAVFEILPASEIDACFPELARVSDAWLDDKLAREKGFTLGAFNRDYMRQFPCAVVKIGGKIVAFANIWDTDSREELSVDLMRFSNEAPRGTMDYMFVHLMLWGHEQGYRWFSLGMAPFSGLASHRLAPFKTKLATLIYRHGEHFYNFQGLRSYKEKFRPVWSPKYLACPGGFAVPGVLLDVSTLVSGGASNGPRN